MAQRLRQMRESILFWKGNEGFTELNTTHDEVMSDISGVECVCLGEASLLWGVDHVVSRLLSPKRESAHHAISCFITLYNTLCRGSQPTLTAHYLPALQEGSQLEENKTQSKLERGHNIKIWIST